MPRSILKPSPKPSLGPENTIHLDSVGDSKGPEEAKSPTRQIRFNEEVKEVTIVAQQESNPTSKLQNAFRKFIEKKRDEHQKKEDYFNKVLAETKQDYL